MEKSKVLLGITPRDEPDDVQKVHNGSNEERSGSSEDDAKDMRKRIGVRSGPLSILELR
ncbi:MAG: hypothetical protein ACMUIG_01315 [Thermoplasmatota archaeon]